MKRTALAALLFSLLGTSAPLLAHQPLPKAPVTGSPVVDADNLATFHLPVVGNGFIPPGAWYTKAKLDTNSRMGMYQTKCIYSFIAYMDYTPSNGLYWKPIGPNTDLVSMPDVWVETHGIRGLATCPDYILLDLDVQ